jgi:hypothetical protein
MPYISHRETRLIDRVRPLRSRVDRQGPLDRLGPADRLGLADPGRVDRRGPVIPKDLARRDSNRHRLTQSTPAKRQVIPPVAD